VHYADTFRFAEPDADGRPNGHSHGYSKPQPGDSDGHRERHAKPKPDGQPNAKSFTEPIADSVIGALDPDGER